MKRLNNIHPGEVLLEEFLKPLGISAYRLSKDLNIPQTRVSQIIKGKRKVTSFSATNIASLLLVLQGVRIFMPERKEPDCVIRAC